MKYEEQVFVNSHIESNQGNVLRRSLKQRCISVTDVMEFFKHLKESSLFQGCSDFVLYVPDNTDNRHLYTYLLKDMQGDGTYKYKLVKHYCFASPAKCIKVYDETKKLLKLKDILFFSMNSCSKNIRVLNPQYRLTYDLCENSQWEMRNFSFPFLSFEFWCDSYNVKYTPKSKENTKVVTKEKVDVNVLVDVDGKTQTIDDILKENKVLKRNLEHIWEEQEDWKKKKEDFEKQCLKCQEHYLKESAYNDALKKELDDVKQRLKSQDFEMWMASVSFDKLRERNLELTKESQELKTKYAIFEVPHIKAKWQTFLETLKRMEDINGNQTETITTRD